MAVIGGWHDRKTRKTISPSVTDRHYKIFIKKKQATLIRFTLIASIMKLITPWIITMWNWLNNCQRWQLRTSTHNLVKLLDQVWWNSKLTKKLIHRGWKIPERRGGVEPPHQFRRHSRQFQKWIRNKSINKAESQTTPWKKGKKEKTGKIKRQ